MTVVRFPRAGKSDDPDLDPFNLFVALIESVVPVAWGLPKDLMMLRLRVAMVLLASGFTAAGQTFEPHSTNCIETAPLGLWSPWVEFDEDDYRGQWFVADGPLGGTCSSGGGFFPAGNKMVSGKPVDVRGLGAGERFITAILTKKDRSERPIRMVWSVQITEPGDVNGDGLVSFADFMTISRQYGNETGRQNGDIDYSGDVGFSDFVLLTQNYGNRVDEASGVVAAAASVPEPSTWGGSIAMLMALGLLRRRRFRSAK